MTQLTTAELASMQADIEQLLPDSGTVMARTLTSDGMGGLVEAWGTASVGIACRIDAYRGRETLAAGAVNPYQQFVLSMPHDTTITAANRFRMGTVDYNVISVNSGSWLAVRRAILEVV